MSYPQRSARLVVILALFSALLGITSATPQANANTAARKYYVDSTGDAGISANPNACESDFADGDCTLRQAIQKANADAGTSVIDFLLLPTSDPNYDLATDTWTIKPTNPLPALTDAAGGTQILGRIDNVPLLPRIVIDGSMLSNDGNGFQITSSDNVITRLIIINFKGSTLTTGNAVRITGTNAKRNQVLACYIGSLPGQATQKGNQQAGVLIDGGAMSNRVGASGTNRNFINSNGYNRTNQVTFGDGIRISGFGTAENVVQGNYIGIGVTAGFTEIALANTGYGIQISDSSNNTIGGNSLERNIISGNAGTGIVVTGAGSTGNNIYGNYIGTAGNGLTDIGNGGSGIILSAGANGNTIGGVISPVIISGNTDYGVLITDADTNNNTLRDSYIGLNESGNVAVNNDKGGVRIQDDASNNTIGVSGGRNIISGNTGYGISISRVDSGSLVTNGNKIINNIIGLDQTARINIGNSLGGIQVDSSANNTIVGGLAEGEGNIISANGGLGITINATAVSNTTVQGNIIGLKRATINGPFNTAAGNQGGGIYVAPLASTVTIGGDATQKNKIAYNVGDGIQVNVGATNITITSNDVTTNTLHGINLTGVTAPIINDNNANNNGRSAPGTGILVSNAPNAQVLRNTANLNSEHGISVSSSNNLLLNNSTANQNTLNGILVTSVLSSTLAANTANQNGNNGVFVSASDAAKISATTASLNLNSGLLLGLSTRVTITGTTAEANTLHGISLVDTGPFTATDNLTLHANQRAGFRASGSFNHSQIRNNKALANLINGFVLQGPTTGLTQHISMTNNLAEGNTGSGLLIDGALKDVLVQKNNFYSNSVNGVQLGGTLTPQPQQIKLDENSFTGNGIPANTPNPVPSLLYGNGIVLNPETRLAGTATNPNHDIDPPVETSLVAWDNGQFTGHVLTGTSPDACLPTPITPAPVPAPICKLQIFSTDAQRLDGQGFALLKNVNVSANGYFTTTLGLGVVPKQLALTATDMYSNTSEFALFNVNPSLLFDTAQAKQARPGDTVTFVHTLTNNGNVAFTNVQLGFEATKNNIRLTKWDVSAIPTGAMTIKPGETKTVTTTVKLPLGSDTEVAAGTVGNVKLVAQTGNTPNASLQVEVVDTLTILPRVVLDVQPTALPGSGRPGEVVTYLHTVTNNGNVAATVAISYNTLVAGGTAPTWTTVLEPPTTMTLQAGQSLGLTVKVTVSQTSQLGTEAQTIIKLTPSTSAGVDLTQEKTVTDTTRTTLDPAATLVPPSQELPGAAGEVTSFQHCATNISNGEATFKIQAVSSQGSSVTFSDNDPLVNLVNGNTFTLAQGANFCFFVNVNVERRLLPGQKDVVTVVLQDAQGGSIGGASAQDTINVQRGIMYPRLYLPLVLKP